MTACAPPGAPRVPGSLEPCVPDALAVGLWPRDRHGRLLPAAPVKGLLFLRYRTDPLPRVLRRASRHGFVVTCLGRVHHEAPPSAWVDWLDALTAHHPLDPDRPHEVVCHLPGCLWATCDGCDTAHVGRIADATAAPRASSTPARRHLPATHLSDDPRQALRLFDVLL